jgi:hypothetical protein
MAVLNNSNAITTSGAYDINNSLRFRASVSARLSRTFGSATNYKIQTLSAWVKRGLLSSSTTYRLMGGYDGSAANSTEINFNNDTLRVEFGGAASNSLITTQVFRDPSAWYHIVIAIDTTQATAANRVKMYVNGNQITAFGTANYPAQNANSQLTSANANNSIGAGWSGFDYFDGYMTEVNFIDGQVKTPSDFGETDTTTGSWKPKAYSGTYGTNGFYLKFSDIATTSGSNAGLGKDFSGNANYWTTNNISVTAGTTYDAMTDSPTNTSATVANYAVMNPLNAISTTGGNTTTLSNANLSVLMPNTAGSRTAFATMGVSSGKWYWETTITTGSINTYYPGLGIDTNLNALPTDQSGGTASGYMYLSNGQKLNSASLTAYGSSFTTNDVIGVALDMDAGTITFYKNNTSQGQAFSGITGTAVPCVVGQNNAALAINFGQRPFTYTPPTGFVRLNTYNLPDSTIKKGNTVMDATTYTGTGTSRTVTNAGSFKTDLVWVKSRNNAGTWHILADSVRGAGYQLSSNQTNAEIYDAQGVGFASNGFTLGADTVDAYYGWNINGDTYVGWQWQAGQGTTSSNTSGSITSTVSVNTTAGFSVVTYTGNGGTGATVGHGLGVAPKMVIVKQRSSTEAWVVGHQNLTGWNYILNLNSTAAQFIPSTQCLGTPTSTNIVVGPNASTNSNTATYVAYCWAEIAGFSKFTSYTGNGSADGPFVYCGFRPKFIMIKRTVNAGGSWAIYDTARNTYNVANLTLYPNLSSADDTYDVLDFTSNGFKIRTSALGVNQSGDTFIVAAFAENPFKNSLAR